MDAETNGRRWPRRALAGAICGVWAGAKLAAVAAAFAAGTVATGGDRLAEAAREIHGYAEATQTEMFVVLAFYFGGRHVDNLLSMAVGKLRGRPPA